MASQAFSKPADSTATVGFTVQIRAIAQGVVQSHRQDSRSEADSAEVKERRRCLLGLSMRSRRVKWTWEDLVQNPGTMRGLTGTNLGTQSRTLAALRDTLLPKLLSGELSVAATNHQFT